MSSDFHRQGAAGIAMDARERAEWFAAKELLRDAGATQSVLKVVKTYLRDHPPTQKDALFSDALEEFLTEKMRIRRSERTIESLESRLRLFASTAGIIRCSDVTRAEVERFVFRRGASTATIINDITVIRSWCRWAAKPRNGYLATDPTADIERPAKKAEPPVALKVDEALACLHFSDTQRPEFRLYVYLAVLAGLRQSEILNLPLVAIESAERTGILAVVGVGKRGRSRRQVPVPRRLREVLRELAGVNPQWLKRPHEEMRVTSGAADKWCPDILRHT